MIKFNCYQCDKVDWLFGDSRCADCTRVNPESGYIDKEDFEELHAAGVVLASDDLLPEWATGRTTTFMTVGAQLRTRDGRRCGNAVVVDVAKRGFNELTQSAIVLAAVATDIGTRMHLDETELIELFYEPEWTMDVTTHHGARKAYSKLVSLLEGIAERLKNG
jgi:hypothetical protein